MVETNFKHTEIGLIPHDWEVKTLGELFIFNAGGDVQKDCYSTVKIGDKTNPIYSNSLENKGLYGYTSNPRYTANAITITGRGSLGHAEYRNHAFDAIVRLLVLSPIRDTIDCSFVTNEINFLVPFVFESTGVPQLTVPQAQSAIIPLPPTLAEQERIAGALSSIDTLIGALNEQIEKKRHIKQGTMQQLLTGKKRLAGFTGEWIEKSIDELGDLTGAGVDKTSKEDEIPVRLVNYLDVFHRDTIYNRELNFWVTANETKLQQCNVKCGDVFFTPSSEMPYDIALSAVAMEDMRNVCYSYHIYRLRFKENIDLNYRAYMFKAASFYEQANTTCEGSGKRYVISLTKFKKLSVYYPVDIAEQRAIAAVLSGMDTEIAALEQKRDKYIAIKSGMMQDLLTGKIRLV
ncbi:MAG: restriction endonuclease subunit S [Paludibacteraceae bacterium]|nr:restriction endonuclease subunit S [Paludibacteraceae bacterium]